MRFIYYPLILSFSLPLWAGSPLKTDPLGYPLVWEKGATVTYNPEAGGLKPDGGYDQAKTLQLLKEAFGVWTNIPGSSIKSAQGAFLNDGDAIDASNFESVLYYNTKSCYPEVLGPVDTLNDTPCVSPIVFDENGEIMESLFGECNQYTILGLGSVDDINNMTGEPERRIVRRARLLLSGACIGPVSAKPGCSPCSPLSEAEVRTVVIHELGHFLGLGHAQVNPQAYQECKTAPGGCPAGAVESIPTMFPVNVRGANMATLHRDDVAYFQSVYAASGDTCSIEGKVSGPNGELSGVEVVARNTKAEQSDALAFVSGNYAPKDAQGNCSGDCGGYRIVGAKAGESYQICAQSIDANFTGISSLAQQKLQSIPSFPETCPSGLVFTCSCPEPGKCSEFKNVNLSVDPSGSVNVSNNPDLIQTQTNASPGAGGGCNLRRGN